MEARKREKSRASDNIWTSDSEDLQRRDKPLDDQATRKPKTSPIKASGKRREGNQGLRNEQKVKIIFWEAPLSSLDGQRKIREGTVG